MTRSELYCHERLGMLTRARYGYSQHDDHLWRWLNHHLAIWGRVYVTPTIPPDPAPLPE